MDSNSPNSVEQFYDALSRCKAENIDDHLLHTVFVHMKAGKHTFKTKTSKKSRKLPFSPELRGLPEAFNIEEETEYSSSASGVDVDQVYKQAQFNVCEIVVKEILQSFTDSNGKIAIEIDKSLDHRSQLKLLCDKITVESMDVAFTESIQLEIQVNKDVTCTYNKEGHTLLKKGDKFKSSTRFKMLKHAKNETFGLAYDKVTNNLGPDLLDASRRGPKTFNKEDTYLKFENYLIVVGSHNQNQSEKFFNCFGQIELPESYDEDKILYLPLQLKKLCEKAGKNLKNITVEEVASEVEPGNKPLYREMSIIFEPGASNNKRQKIVPFPDNVLIIPKRSLPRVYPPPRVPKIEDLQKLIPIKYCSDEEWTIETINSAQRMIEIGKGDFMKSKVLGIDFEADDEHLALMSVTNYGIDRRIFVFDLVLNDVRGNFSSVIGKMLEDPDILKIGHSLTSLDRPKLLRELDCMMVCMYDTQILYKLSSQCETIGLETALSMCKIPRPANRNADTKKAYQLWNWCRRPIDRDALKYAAMDVAHLGAMMTYQFKDNSPTVIGNVLTESNKELKPSK